MIYTACFLSLVVPQYSWSFSRVTSLAPSLRAICRHEFIWREKELQQRREGWRELYRCVCVWLCVWESIKGFYFLIPFLKWGWLTSAGLRLIHLSSLHYLCLLLFEHLSHTVAWEHVVFVFPPVIIYSRKLNNNWLHFRQVLCRSQKTVWAAYTV